MNANASGSQQRRCGVLLHPTSLPGRGYCGDFGTDARRFIDLMASAGLQIWQVLPLGPTHPDGCPYQSFSVHAGSPDLIDLQWLVERGWLSRQQALRGLADRDAKRAALDLASKVFFAQLESGPDSPVVEAYQAFLESAGFWLEDYVRFHAFRQSQQQRSWVEWPQGLRDRDQGVCDALATRLDPHIRQLRFRQFVFDCQWRELRDYANRRGVMLFGDIPIYVHFESADVWAHQGMFDLDEVGRPVTVTGVPPDYFCAEGQLWGNPQYNWARMRETGFDWWLHRFESAARQFDIARIDHFRALQAYWEIPAGAVSAREGHWVEAPGRELLQAVRHHYPELKLVAENLGSITAEVEALRKEFRLPGMLILQFAFDGNPDNPYLSHMHQGGDIVYTGTHDNDTTLGWFESLDGATRERVYAYFGNPPEAMPWMLIRQAASSVANTAIIPWQDFLGLDGRHRMNTPGTTEGNWRWRFDWSQVPPGLAGEIRDLLASSHRSPPGPARVSAPADRGQGRIHEAS
ncbi:MAG: 4-alpha-glucanotransferase [Gammaproteobacteria bacterium]|nr:4-alpha-glucanotransferase [Gammaproteobacteria bacterium]